MKLSKTIYLSLLGLMGATTYAQELSSDIQLRPRYEYTNGFGTLLTPTTSHTSFIGQRSRLNLNYGDEKLKVKLSLQSVRTWGDVPTTATIASAKNGIALFEGWAQYKFSEKFSLKAGRQMLSYDNQRIIGGLDWANQGRSFDAAVLTFKGAKSQLDLGFSSNEDSEAKTDAATAFVTDHKNMQYAWFHTAAGKLGISFLALNVGKEYAKTATVLETNYIQTIGTYTTFKDKKFDADFSFYGQTGKIGVNTVSAWEGALNLGYAFTPKFKTTLGYEYLSGKDVSDTSSDVKTFAPLFGTNHAFNGTMDYFYVGFANKSGLQDLSLKLEFPIQKVKLTVQPHAFMTAQDISATSDSYLGTEVDVTAVYKLYKDVTVIGGYSQMFATTAMEALKGGISDTTTNWAWVMVNINPQIFSTKK